MPDETLPDEVIDEAERLTRLARQVVDEQEAAAYRRRRDELVADHDYETRVREDEDGATLVCYPAEWVDDDGLVRTERIDDLDRGVERSLSGPGDPEAWSAVDDHNREVVAAVRDAHGDVHAANVDAFADFLGNHYAKPIERATDEEVAEFLTEYYPRNVWASAAERAVVEKSLELAFAVVDERYPFREKS